MFCVFVGCFVWFSFVAGVGFSSSSLFFLSRGRACVRGGGGGGGGGVCVCVCVCTCACVRACVLVCLL